jgi:endonuclease/exonuclease/phosphatase family metal-dependent hydrolase
MGGVASSANGLLSKLEPVEVQDHPCPAASAGAACCWPSFGDGDDGLAVAVAHLSLGAGSRMSQLGFIAELLSDTPTRC